MTKKNQHVAPNSSGQWSVKKTGSSKATKVFASQAEAVEFARHIAKNNASELYIHKKDGTIREKNSYSKDQPSTKNKK